MGRGGGRSAAGAAILGLGLLLAGCGTSDPELTTEQFLEKLKGRPMTSIEVDEQLELAELFCGFQGPMLNEIWARLDARQLEFQDFVFGQHCPDRLSVYAAARPDVGTAPVAATTSTTIDASLLDRVEQITTSSSSTTSTTSSNSSSTTTTTTTTSSTSTTSR